MAARSQLTRCVCAKLRLPRANSTGTSTYNRATKESKVHKRLHTSTSSYFRPPVIRQGLNYHLRTSLPTPPSPHRYGHRILRRHFLANPRPASLLFTHLPRCVSVTPHSHTTPPQETTHREFVVSYHHLILNPRRHSKYMILAMGRKKMQSQFTINLFPLSLPFKFLKRDFYHGLV